MKKLITRVFALFAALGLVIAAGLPALAGGGLGIRYEGLAPDTIYNMTSVTFDVPLSDFGYSGIALLSGTDVSRDAVTLTEEQGPYNFVYEQTLTADSYYSYGVMPQLLLGPSVMGGAFSQQIPIDGDTLFGFQNSPSEIRVKMTFTDVILPASSADLYMYNEFEASGPYLPLSGSITIELTTTIDGTYTIPHSTSISDEAPHTDAFAYDVQRYLEEMQSKIKDSSSKEIIHFDKPKTFTAKIELEGSLIELDGSPEMDTLAIAGRLSNGNFLYTTEFDNQTYETVLMERTENENIRYLDRFAIDCPLYVNIRSWDLTRHGSLGYDSPDNSGGAYYPDADDDHVGEGYLGEDSFDNVINQPEKVVLITAGTSAAALGVSILLSLVGDTASSSVVSALGSSVADNAIASVLSDGQPTISGSSSSSSSSSSVAKLTDTSPEEIAADNDDKSSEESDVDSPEETPELPEEDSPEVSMSLFAPAKDLLNIKGGAADVTVQIKGGEGYIWHYIPAVIVPGSVKAIVPTVTGRSHLATLILGMTGAKLEDRHYEVFIKLIAWAVTPSGKLLKTSASLDMALHEPGIEAKFNDKGFPAVTAYVETTLKGFAEIRKLSSDEYTYSKLDDGSFDIKAVDKRLGTTLLKAKKES